MARDSAALKKSTYKLQAKDLDEKAIKYFSELFLKQGTVYFSLLAEDRQLIVAHNGLDTTNYRMMNDFLYNESLAMGLSAQFIALQQELLLMPPASESVWQALVEGACLLSPAFSSCTRMLTLLLWT